MNLSFAQSPMTIYPVGRSLPQWMYAARLADTGFSEDADYSELRMALRSLTSAGVTVAETGRLLRVMSSF